MAKNRTAYEEQKIKLESMQIKGIRAMIWQNIEKDNIESRLLQIKKQNYTNDLQKLVNSQSRAVLIELIEMSPEIYPQTIDAAYEKYRYGLKPGFTLFWAKRSNDISFDKDSLETKIKEFISTQKYGEDDKYKNLEFVSIIEFGGTYEISLSYLQKFNYINEDGEFMVLDNETMEFSYRNSIIKNRPFIVVETTLLLIEGKKEEIKQKMDELNAKRREKQPLNYPSAGSTFKRPEGHFAGKLIMDAGLRGFRIGGARVSEKHCGFIINEGNATATDVADLIDEVTERVEEKFGVTLETEIIKLGDF